MFFHSTPYKNSNSLNPLFQSREARALGDLILQPSQPLPRILNLRDTRVSVFPEVEEIAHTPTSS